MKEIIINYLLKYLSVRQITVENRFKLASVCHIVFYLIFIRFVFFYFLFPNYLALNLYRSMRFDFEERSHTPHTHLTILNTNKYSINSATFYSDHVKMKILSIFSILNWMIAWKKKNPFDESTNTFAIFSGAIKIKNKNVSMRLLSVDDIKTINFPNKSIIISNFI